MQTVVAFLNSIFRNPPILLGLVAMLGLVLQKKSFADIVKGSVLAALGMFMLDLGVGVLVGSILPINATFQGAFNASISAGLDATSFTAGYGSSIGTAMLIAFVLHILIARFTPFKNIFLTGHFLWWIPFVFTAVGVGGGLTGITLIIFSAVLSALYWSITPFIYRPFVRAVTGDDSFTLGHPSFCLAIIAGAVAKVVGDKSKSTEDINVPKSLSFLREIAVTGSVVIFLMFIVIGLAFRAQNINGDEGLFLYAIKQGLMFGAGLTIMLAGVRMLIGQLLPAFQGISMKLVPNAIPALDCPIIFSYRPNAVIIGFLVAMTVSTITIAVSIYMGWFGGVILIPLVVTSFFECGTAAVVAEGQGGLRGAIIGTTVAAVFMVIILGLSISVFATTIMNWILIFGGNDLSLFGILTSFITKVL